MPPAPRICGARTRDGESCRRAPVPGGRRCNFHGGYSPQSLKLAQETLAAGALPALGELFEIKNDLMDGWRGSRCDACGRLKSDPNPIIRIITTILDRSGFGPGAKLDVHHHAPSHDAAGDHYTMWIPDWQLEQMEAWMDEARKRMERGEPKAPATTLRLVEGKVVSDEPRPDDSVSVARPEGSNPDTSEPPS